MIFPLVPSAMKKLLSIILVTLALSVAAQDDSVWTRRAAEITAGCKTAYSKAQAIYRWECLNIQYDWDMKIHSAKNCWKLRKGICQAYSELFCVLAEHCGLRADLIRGVAKGTVNGESHSWVIANTEKGWILIDPTWGAGSTYDSTEASMAWFDVKPEVMIFSHFPDDPKDQHLATPLTYEQYNSLPNMPAAVTQAGWNGTALLNHFLNHPQNKPPKFYLDFTLDAGKFRLISAPYDGALQAGKTYTFKIQILDPKYELGGTGKWTRNGNIYTCVYTAKKGEDFMIRINSMGIMKYTVL